MNGMNFTLTKRIGILKNASQKLDLVLPFVDVVTLLLYISSILQMRAE